MTLSQLAGCGGYTSDVYRQTGTDTNDHQPEWNLAGNTHEGRAGSIVQMH
jgi:hypothetical protein